MAAEEDDVWGEGDVRVENVVLMEIATLHPDHLTSEELVVRLEEDRAGASSPAIEDSIEALRRSGLVRLTGEVIEPTYAALRAVEILQQV
jgi:DNA topoisomerase IA